MPFAVAFMIAYLLDPFVTYLSNKKIPRWLVALVIVLTMISVVTAIAILVFPLMFSQVDDAIKKISALLNDTSKYLESRRFYNTLAKMGIPKETLKQVVQHEIIPKIDGVFSTILSALMSMLSQVSMLGTQIVNVILIPIMTFYFLKDFGKLRNTISKILGKKNEKLLHDLIRINKIFKIYIGWQITAAILIGTSCSALFTLFGVPYPIVLGIICGFMNPIPYLGTLMSLGICFVTMLIVGPANFWQIILIIVLILNGLHFINAYFLEPNIVGKQVGLHPIVLIASLFIFGGLFGFLGLMVAVPCTAAIMMFFDDWMKRSVEDQILVE
jgi:predicted PurR-regulated permease PerM